MVADLCCVLFHSTGHQGREKQKIRQNGDFVLLPCISLAPGEMKVWQSGYFVFLPHALWSENTTWHKSATIREDF
jgi:hypothetical protein